MNDHVMTDTFREHKNIAQQAQASVLYHPKTPQGFLSVKVGFRSYRFMTGCACEHLHLVADGGATLEVCGGDCEAHPFEHRPSTVATFQVSKEKALAEMKRTCDSWKGLNPYHRPKDTESPCQDCVDSVTEFIQRLGGEIEPGE